jgi:hypothetical protein
MILNQFGSIPHDLAMDNIRLTATKVLPNLRQIWEGEWEDRWWIKPMARPQMPAPLLGAMAKGTNGRAARTPVGARA